MCIRTTDAILDALAKPGPAPLPRRGLVRVESGQLGDWRYLSIGENSVKLTRYLSPAETITFCRGTPAVRRQLEVLKGGCWIKLPAQIPRNDAERWRVENSKLEASGPCSCDVASRADESTDEPEFLSRLRGSKKHVRDLISSPDGLESINSVIGVAGGAINSSDRIRPSAQDNFKEWELPAFLNDDRRVPPRPPVNFSHFDDGWWPDRGPKWDMICTCRIDGRPGLLLVEAKAHSKELAVADKCRATGESLAWIIRSLNQASKELQSHWPGTSLSADHHYQLSNRIAWAWKAANAGIPVILLSLGFTGDNEVRPGCGFSDHAHWLREFQKYVADVIPHTALDNPVALANGGSLRLLVGSLPVKTSDERIADKIVSSPLPIELFGSPTQFCDLKYDEAADVHDFTLNELFKTRILGGDPGGTLMGRLQSLEDWGVISEREQTLLEEFTDLFVMYDDLNLDEIVERCEGICNRLRQIPANRVAQIIAELALRAARRERATLDGGEAGPLTTVEGLADRATRAFSHLPTAENFESPVEVAFGGAVAGALALAEFGECSAYHGAVVGAAVAALHCFDIPRY